MPINLGPCACCGGYETPPEPEICCEPLSCMHLIVTITGTTAMDGTYTATWNSAAGDDLGWQFDIGDCSYVVQANNSSDQDFTGTIWMLIDKESSYHTFYTSDVDYETDCTQADGIASIDFPYSYNASGSEDCSFGSTDLGGGNANVAWHCWYPEYMRVVTDIPDGTGDCSGFENFEYPIDCGSSTLCFFYYSTGTVTIIYDREDMELHFEYLSPVEIRYTATSVTMEDILSGDPITLSLVLDTGNTDCTWPSEIELEGVNNGDWC